MSTSNHADIDSLLADYSERVAEYGLDSPQAEKFRSDHSSDGDFVELAGVLRHLRESPPRIDSAAASAVPVQSHARVLPFGLAGVLVLLLGSITWVVVDRAMDERGAGSPEDMLAMRESGPSASTEAMGTVEDAIVTLHAASDPTRVSEDEFAWRMPASEYQTADADLLAALLQKGVYDEALLSESRTVLTADESDRDEQMTRFLIGGFTRDAITTNLLAEAFLRDATASEPIDLPKLNMAYALARLAVSLETPDLNSTRMRGVRPRADRILDTYGRVLDAIAETMQDDREDAFVLTLDRSTDEDWQRVIAAFEATLENPFIDEESKALARQRIMALTIPQAERSPSDDRN